MSLLIVLLGNGHASDGAVLDYAVTDDGRSARECARSPLAQLPRAARVVVLIPPERLSWHRVTLPRGSLARGWWRGRDAQHLRRVLDGLLEDHLLDEPQDLHLALQPDARDQSEVLLAACERTWLLQHLQMLRQSGLSPQRILPLLAPDNAAAALHLAGEPDHVHLVSLQGALPLCLPLQDSSVQALRATQDTVVATPALAACGETFFQQRLQVQAQAQRLLQASQSRWDLAQFEFAAWAPSGVGQRLVQALATLWQSPHWRPARWALLTLVLVQVIGLQALAWQTRASLHTRQAELETTLRQTFPHVTAVLDAPLQMERELSLLRRTSATPGARDLEVMLSALGQAGVTDLDTLDYAGGELRLRSRSGTPALGAHTSAMAGMGYRLDAEGERSVLRGQD